MTWILSIEPQQEPFDVGPDDRGRAQISFNVLCRMRASSEFVQDLIAILIAAGVGTTASIFGSSQAVVPIGDGPYLQVRSTAGVAPEGTHNDGPGAYRRPGAQILVFGQSFAAADAMARSAYNALIAVRNAEVT